MPEIMWRASVMGRSLPERVRGRLRARFHLRALLDELPESDARAALRFFVFPTATESLARLSGGPSIDDLYDPGRRSALISGLERFANHLYGCREQLELLTGSAIRAVDCHSAAAAHQFLCDTLLHD